MGTAPCALKLCLVSSSALPHPPQSPYKEWVQDGSPKLRSPQDLTAWPTLRTGYQLLHIASQGKSKMARGKLTHQQGQRQTLGVCGHEPGTSGPGDLLQQLKSFWSLRKESDLPIPQCPSHNGLSLWRKHLCKPTQGHYATVIQRDKIPSGKFLEIQHFLLQNLPSNTQSQGYWTTIHHQSIARHCLRSSQDTDIRIQRSIQANLEGREGPQKGGCASPGLWVWLLSLGSPVLYFLPQALLLLSL